MYYSVVASLMFIFPLASVVVDLSSGGHGTLGVSVEKWFVFWAVGLRLLLAGLRQIIQPRYTAEKILGLKDTDAVLVVRELGFANTAIGAIGVASLMAPSWVLPAAILGVLFYGMAGINHLPHKMRNPMENVAMVSDLFVAIVLMISIAATMVLRRSPA